MNKTLRIIFLNWRSFALFFIVLIVIYHQFNNVDIGIAKTGSNGRKFESAIILGKARGGSNLMAALLNTHNSFLWYEPILVISNEVKNQKFDHSVVVKDVLQCNFPPKYENLIPFSSKIHKDLCASGFMSAICENILKFLCLSSKFLIIKTVLLSLQDAVRAIEKAETDTGIIYLIRDPRAIIASRNEFLSILTEKVDVLLENHTSLCDRVRSEVQYFKMNENVKKKIMFVKYEDLVLHPSKTVRNIYNFLGRTYSVQSDIIVNFRLKIKPEKTSVYNLILPERDSKTRLGAWRKTMTLEYVEDIQNGCQYVMDKFNYKLIHNEHDLVKDSFELYS